MNRTKSLPYILSFLIICYNQLIIVHCMKMMISLLVRPNIEIYFFSSLETKTALCHHGFISCSVSFSKNIIAFLNPCDPNPCGAGVCSVKDGVGLCHCPPGLHGEECQYGESD